MPRTEPTAPGLTTGSTFALYLYRRWWFIAAQAAAAVVALVLVLGLTSHTTYDYTAHFVLHPDASSNLGDVANAASVLRQDDPLVQTVLKVIPNNEIRRRAGAAAGIDPSKYSVSATVSPGSSFFDATVRGRDASETRALGKSLETVVSGYVNVGYRGFALDVLGSDTATNTSFPPSPSLVALVLLFGAALAAGELFAVFGLAHLRTLAARAEARAETTAVPPEPIAKPKRTRVAKPAVADASPDAESALAPPVTPKPKRTRVTKVANDTAPADAPPVVGAITEPKPKSKRTRAAKSDRTDEPASVTALERPSWWPERVQELEAVEPDAQPTSDDRRSAAGR